MEKYCNYFMLLGIALSQARGGAALECWTCYELYDEECAGPFKPENNDGVTFVQRECPLREYSMPPWLPSTETPVCIKLVAKIGDIELVTRKCSSRGKNETSQCLQGMDGVLFCESCEEDGCNSAARVKAGLLFASLILWQRCLV